jgi:hypothetical protein
LFELGGKALQHGGDLRRLLDERGGHALSHVRLGADEFRGGQDQRQMIVDVMAHVGKLAIQFTDLLDEDRDVGRELEFLCQEMNRETNTISSKSISTSIIHSSVLIKEEIEKIREQIQNIE